MGRIFLVNDGEEVRSLLGVFTGEWAATSYRAELLRRYKSGASLAIRGRTLAPDLGSWRMGFGPRIREYDIDVDIAQLPGAWATRIDTNSKILSSRFTLDAAPKDRARVLRLGIDATIEGFGLTPKESLDAAKAEARRFLKLPAARFR